MAAIADPDAKKAVALELGVTTTTLYEYVNGDDTPKATADAVLRQTARP